MIEPTLASKPLLASVFLFTTRKIGSPRGTAEWWRFEPVVITARKRCRRNSIPADHCESDLGWDC